MTHRSALRRVDESAAAATRLLERHWPDITAMHTGQSAAFAVAILSLDRLRQQLPGPGPPAKLVAVPKPRPRQEYVCDRCLHSRQIGPGGSCPRCPKCRILMTPPENVRPLSSAASRFRGEKASPARLALPLPTA